MQYYQGFSNVSMDLGGQDGEWLEMMIEDPRRASYSKLAIQWYTMVHPIFFQPEPNANSSSGGSANLVRKQTSQTGGNLDHLLDLEGGGTF